MKQRQQIFALAIPATIDEILHTLVGFIDGWLITRISLVAVTAVGIANTILNVYLALFIALGVAAMALISRALGQMDPFTIKKRSAQALVLSFLLGLLLTIFSLLFSKDLMATLGTSGDVFVESHRYFWVVSFGTIFMGLSTTLGTILRSYGDTKSPMKINLVMNLANVLLDVLLIFGLGPIPALGLLGTAYGTVIARILGCALLFTKLQKTPYALSFSDFKQSTGTYRPLISLALPASLERLAMRLGQVLYFSLILAIGEKAFAAHTMAGNIESFTYLPASGLATAATILVAKSLGEKNWDQIRSFVNKILFYGILCLSMIGFLLFTLAPLFASAFTQDSTANALIITALRIDAFAQPFTATSMILTGVLHGLGDTKSPLFATFAGMWFFRVAGVWLLGIQWNLGLAGVWLAILIDLALRSFILAMVVKGHQNAAKRTAQ